MSWRGVGFYSVALDSSGNAWAWGGGLDGRLGNGAVDNSSVPVAVTMPAGTTFTRVRAGYQTAYAIDQAGGLWAWGDGGSGALGDGTNTNPQTTPVAVSLSGAAVGEVVAGRCHAVAMSTDASTVWSWGCNSDGQLGDGTSDDRNTPASITWESAP